VGSDCDWKRSREGGELAEYLVVWYIVGVEDVLSPLEQKVGKARRLPYVSTLFLTACFEKEICEPKGEVKSNPEYSETGHAMALLLLCLAASANLAHPTYP
jgi:hypothetical protein